MSNENIAEAGKEFRWQKGCPSPNPGGRPKKRPISERYAPILEMPLPEALRLELEAFLGAKLKRKATFGDAVALSVVLSALGVETGVRLDAVREIRESVEGKTAQRIEISEPEQPKSEEDIKNTIRMALVGRVIERAKLYNMPIPALTEMADEAGVDLGIPREDGKPQ